MGVVVDTSCLIEIERRLSGRELRPEELPSDPIVSAVSVAELRVGIELSDALHRPERLRFVEEVLSHCPIVPFGAAEAEEYALMVAALRRAGKMIGERDLMIAATALAGGHEVMTRNIDEFSRVPGLVLRSLP